MKQFDIISIGDTTHDIFVSLPKSAAGVNCEIDRHECKLLLGYGDKLPVNKLEHVYAVGNAANNAVGMARMGFNNALYTNLGNDDASNLALEIFAKEGVGLDFIQKHNNTPGNLSVVINYEGERVILVYHQDWNYKLPDFKTQWVYYTSLSENHESLNNEVVEYVKNNGVKMGFNPGTHQMKKGLKVLKPVIEQTEIFIVNKLEAGRILGVDVEQEKKNIEESKMLLTKIYEFGAKNVVITQGPVGTWGFDGRSYWHLPTNNVPVVERTGTGDAFSTGVISGLMAGSSLNDAMRWGALNSESVLQFVGARKGLLTREQMETKLSEHKNYKAVEV